jgi:hypothetical protein
MRSVSIISPASDDERSASKDQLAARDPSAQPESRIGRRRLCGTFLAAEYALATMERRGSRRWALIVAVVLIAAAASGCGSGSTTTVLRQTTPPPQPTAVHIYAPFSSSGTPVLPTARTVTGYCWTTSNATARTDAWRCMTGNDILDPCFAASRVAHFALCPDGGPWSSKVIRMNLSRALPTLEATSPEPSPTTEPAWAVELADGGHCQLLLGAGNVTANLRENYNCSNGVTLYGTANHSTQPWTIFGRHGTTGQLTPQPLAAMWY